MSAGLEGGVVTIQAAPKSLLELLRVVDPPIQDVPFNAFVLRIDPAATGTVRILKEPTDTDAHRLGYLNVVSGIGEAISIDLRSIGLRISGIWLAGTAGDKVWCMGTVL